MTTTRTLPIVFLIAFGFYLVLATQIPGLFDLGFGQRTAFIDRFVSYSPPAVFLGFFVVVVRRALETGTFPWRALIALCGSIAAALIVRSWVDQIAGQEFKAVGAYFYVATPAIAVLGLVAIWAERRSGQPHN